MSASVWMPSSFSRRSVTWPTPHIRDTGRGARKATTASGSTITRPSGFRRSEAIFATNLLGATPADAVSPVPLRISSFMCRASAPASAIEAVVAETSR